MSLVTTLNYINNYIKDNKNNITLEVYTIENKVKPTNTITLENTILKYNLDIKVLFCLNYSINLTNTNYIKHLKKKYSNIYNIYIEEDLTRALINKVYTLEFNTLET